MSQSDDHPMLVDEADTYDKLQAIVSDCTQLSEFTEDQKELAELMSDISERYSYSRWMLCLEYVIWKAIQDNDAYAIDDVKLERAKELSEKLGGWIVWADDLTDENLDSDKWGKRFIPMELWLRILASIDLSQINQPKRRTHD